MKTFAIIFIFLFSGFFANAQDFILPKNFVNHEKDVLSFIKFPQNETLSNGFEQFKNVKFFEAGKKKETDITSIKDIFKKTDKKGLMLVAYELDASPMKPHIDSVVHYFEKRNFLFLADTLKKSFVQNAPNLQIKSQHKILLLSERAFGSLYNQETEQELEVLLQQNPYFGLYGDDVTGILLYKGKPVPFVTVSLSTVNKNGVRTENQNISTDEKGQFYFKTNRLGTWMIDAYYWNRKENPNMIQHAMFSFEFVK